MTLSTTNRNIIFNLAFWLFLTLLFFFSILRFETVDESLRISLLVILPLIIPVYIHNFLFDYFIYRKKYLLYTIVTALLVLFFGYIIDSFQDFIEPEGESETYGALILMMLLYTGSKYFLEGARQRLKIKEEANKRLGAEMEIKELMAKQASAELDLLKSQVNPHFLFNSLNSIYSLTFDNAELAGEAVLKLSDLMRYLLESSKKRKVLVKHELEFLENYIELEKIRLGKKCTVQYEFSGELHGRIISPMLLIPFIENCFKHGISVMAKENLIMISIKIDQHTLVLSSGNNIVRKKAIAEDKKGKTGIENVKKRLELLYPGRYDLNISKAENKYLVNLKIEL